MPINPIRFLSRTIKSVNLGIKSSRFSNTPAGNLARSIKEAIAENRINDALSIFKRVLGFRTPYFAERVLESAPIFAAIVAKMAVDQIMKEFELDSREKAWEIQRLAQECVKKTKRVLPTSSL